MESTMQVQPVTNTPPSTVAPAGLTVAPVLWQVMGINRTDHVA